MSRDQTSLNGTIRQQGGKGGARRLRNTGKIPAVIYGKGHEPVAVSVDPIELTTAIATPHKFNTVITVKLDKGGDKLVLLKDYQQHPVSRQLLHADFQEVRLDQQVTVDVPVLLVGKAAGAQDGGILTQIKRAMSITCLPGQIPASIDVDVSPLKIGQSLHEKDVQLPAGVKLAGTKNETLATVSIPETEAAAPAAAAAAATPAAGAAAAPAAAGKAAAPAAGAKAGDAKAAAPAAGKAAPAKK
jgi:large subunit ribosomal protein L25